MAHGCPVGHRLSWMRTIRRTEMAPTPKQAVELFQEQEKRILATAKREGWGKFRGTTIVGDIIYYSFENRPPYPVRLPSSFNRN